VSKIESQYLFERGVDATLTQRFDQELKGVNRALEKIEEGTYGLSDLSGEPITERPAGGDTGGA